MIDTTFSTSTDNEPITLETIKRAVKLLKENSKRPFLVSIKSRHEWYKTIKKAPVTYGFLIHGTPVIKDDTIPEGIIRFMMSDGTFTDNQYKS